MQREKERGAAGQWLKASMENKITSKNTWSSNLIEEFSDVDRLKERETNSTNFQHASLLLDGCIKVYSTRVDNVAEEAGKLMECIGDTGSSGAGAEKERAGKAKKAQPTIEAVVENITMKLERVVENDDFLEFLARESREGDTRGLMMHLLRWKDGVGLGVLEDGDRSGLEAASFPAGTASLCELAGREKLFDGEQLRHVSPMFAEFTPDLSIDEIKIPTYAYHISYDDDKERKGAMDAFGEDMYAEDLQMGDSNENGFEADMDMDMDIEMAAGEHAPPKEMGYLENRVLVEYDEKKLAVTPFSYFKGWAGPSHWKVTGRQRRACAVREKRARKREIDFAAENPLPPETLFERGEHINLDHAAISERRKRGNNCLPVDYGISIKDLYEKLVYRGKCTRVEVQRVLAPGAEAPGAEEMDPDLPELSFQVGAPEGGEMRGEGFVLLDEDQPPLLQTPSSYLSKRLAQGMFRRVRRMDIVSVKTSVWGLIQEQKESLPLTQIYGEVKRKAEQKEASVPNETSIHFCLVSLLHLANEKGLVLQAGERDVFVVGRG